MTTCDVPTPNVTPPTMVVVKPDPETPKVVEANPTPPGPTLMVCPLTTIVVDGAEGPIENVCPEMIA